FHQLAEAIDIDRLTALFRELDGQLDREAERRGKQERVLAGDRALAGELLELLQAAGERLAEALLLEPHDVLDLLRVVPELRVSVAHLLDDDAAEAIHTVETDALAVLHRTPDDPAADVAPSLIRRRDAVRDQKRHRPPVVGEYAVRLRRDRVLTVVDARLRRDPVRSEERRVGN